MRIEELKAEWLDEQGEWFDNLLADNCDSYIEKLVVGSLLSDPYVVLNPHKRDVFLSSLTGRGVRIASCGVVLEGHCGFFAVQPKIQATKSVAITPDLLFQSRFTPCLIAVELDGHDFHERTKEQASRDKRRDRSLAKLQIVPVRFTGSDVFRDPTVVNDECLAIADSWSKGAV